MKNLILNNSTQEEQVFKKAHTLRLTQYEYLRVVTGKLIKIDKPISTMCGSKFKLVCGDMFGYYYLYAVVDQYGFFANNLQPY
jgi:hypothetical protein